MPVSVTPPPSPPGGALRSSRFSRFEVTRGLQIRKPIRDELVVAAGDGLPMPEWERGLTEALSRLVAGSRALIGTTDPDQTSLRLWLASDAHAAGAWRRGASLCGLPTDARRPV